MLEMRHASGRERLSIATSLLRCVMAVVLVAVTAFPTTMLPNTAAAEPLKVEFNIPSQPIASALRAYARQAKVQLLVLTEGLNAIQANAVVGHLDPQTALQMLLAGTGLQAEYRPDSTVAVRRGPDAAGPVSSVSGNARGRGSLVAHAREDVEALTNIRSPESRQDAASDSDNAQGPRTDIEEIIVLGSNIRGIAAVGAPSLTFTQDELTKAGQSTLGEFFASLPQNLNEISPLGGISEGASRVAGANTPRATGVSLRGLGPGSTLVLLNGKRRPGTVNGRVFDVSAIPLSMVERIDVLTGGRSGIYGSDAVAGVVNIVTVRELDGAESQVYYGVSPAGGERFNFSQTLGRAFDDGGFVLGYVYRKGWPLDATDAEVVQVPSITGNSPIPGLFHLRYASEQHVGLFSGHHELGQNMELYADANFSSDTIEVSTAYNLGGIFDVGLPGTVDANQYSAAGGVRLDAGEHWQIDLSAVHGVVDNTFRSKTFLVPPGTITTSLDLDLPPFRTVASDDQSTLTSFSAIADGPLGKLWNATVSSAIGIDFRNESYQHSSTSLGVDTERDIWSAFVEMHVPLVQASERRLELSLAGRYDHYSDVGGTFNPQIGVEWTPIGDWTFRGSYATAFRAPDLFTLDFRNDTEIVPVDDPLAADGTTMLFTEIGGNPDLDPEEADTWTVGIDWRPSEGTNLSLSYLAVDYRSRVTPATDRWHTVLQEEALYGDLIDRSPTAEQLNERLGRRTSFFNGTTIPFDPENDDPLVVFPDLVLFDNRHQNVALETIEVLDVQASAVLEAPSGDWLFDLNGTYTFDYTRNITIASPPISRLNQPGTPVDLRLRGRIGWSRAAWSVNTFINYVDHYIDPFAPPPNEIDSWTTVDLTLSYDGPTSADRGFLKGLGATIGVNNVFDEDPPHYFTNSFGITYDPANSNAIGRFVSLRVSKRW